MTPAQNRARFRLSAPTVREFKHNGVTYRVVVSPLATAIRFYKNGKWMAANVDAGIERAAKLALSK